MTKENNETLITKEQSDLMANIIEYLSETLGAMNDSMDFIQEPQFKLNRPQYKLNHRHVRQLREATKSLQESIVEHNDMLMNIAAVLRSPDVLRNPDDLEAINSFFNKTEEEKEQSKGWRNGIR